MATTILPIDEVTDALIAQWDDITVLADSLTDEEWAGPSVLPGWTNADIVAHVIGTESLLEGRDVPASRTVSALAHVRNPVGEINEKWVDHFRPQPRADVLAALREIIAVRTASLRAMTQADFDAPTMTPAGQDTYGRFMRIRIFDVWAHDIDLRDATGRSEVTDPVPARFALEEIAASLPFVVAKRAGAPKGSRVIFDVTGIAESTVHVLVDDRAVLVDEFEGGDETADVRLRLDVTNLVRCAGGRRDADLDAVEVTGDRELGHAILTRMNYVI